MADTDYATKEELKPRVSLKLTDGSSDPLLQHTLNTAAYLVDQVTRQPLTGKTAFSATTSETRYFEEQRKDGVLFIDDLLTLTTITRSGTALAADEYTLYPRNQGTGPYTRVEFDAAGTEGTEVAITGTWGYCTLANRPAVVKEATLLIAEKLVERVGFSPKMLAEAMRDPFAALDKDALTMLERAGLVRGRAMEAYFG